MQIREKPNVIPLHGALGYAIPCWASPGPGSGVNPTYQSAPRRTLRVRSLHRADFQHLGDLFAIPAVHQVLALHTGLGEVGVEERRAFATLAAHAVVHDAVGTFLAKARAELS